MPRRPFLTTLTAVSPETMACFKWRSKYALIYARLEVIHKTLVDLLGRRVNPKDALDTAYYLKFCLELQRTRTHHPACAACQA